MVDSGYGRVVTVAIKGHIATVTLQRPESLNAISTLMASELTSAMRELRADPNIWVVILTAAGDRAFCVGADLKERANFTFDENLRSREQLAIMFASVVDQPKPTIAAIFGFTLGGGLELALCCDLILAAGDAAIGLPEARSGLIPAGRGTWKLAEAVGTRGAKEMIFTGRRIDAARAQAIGLVTSCVDRNDLSAQAERLAETICQNSPLSVRLAKSLVDASGAEEENLLESEQHAWLQVARSRDREEGIQAFLAKRDPVWHNA